MSPLPKSSHQTLSSSCILGQHCNIGANVRLALGERDHGLVVTCYVFVCQHNERTLSRVFKDCLHSSDMASIKSVLH